MYGFVAAISTIFSPERGCESLALRELLLLVVCRVISFCIGNLCAVMMVTAVFTGRFAAEGRIYI